MDFISSPVRMLSTNKSLGQLMVGTMLTLASVGLSSAVLAQETARPNYNDVMKQFIEEQGDITSLRDIDFKDLEARMGDVVEKDMGRMTQDVSPDKAETSQGFTYVYGQDQVRMNRIIKSMTINSKREDDAKGGHISLTVMFETPGADDKTVAVVKESLPELVGGLLEELIESKQWEGKIEQAKKNDRTATREISKHARSELSKRVKDAYETAFNIRTVMVVGISGEAKKRRLRARGATSSDTKKPVVAPSAIWGPSKN